MLTTVPDSKVQQIHSNEQHQAIVNAMQQRDGDRAHDLTKEHVSATNSDLKGLL